MGVFIYENSHFSFFLHASKPFIKAKNLIRKGEMKTRKKNNKNNNNEMFRSNVFVERKFEKRKHALKREELINRKKISFFFLLSPLFLCFFMETLVVCPTRKTNQLLSHFSSSTKTKMTINVYILFENSFFLFSLCWQLVWYSFSCSMLFTCQKFCLWETRLSDGRFRISATATCYVKQ